MQILGLLGMYFDAAEVEVKKNLLLFSVCEKTQQQAVKIWLWELIFNVKNHLNLSQFFFSFKNHDNFEIL